MLLWRFAVCGTLIAGLTGCGAVASGVQIEGPAPLEIPWSGQAYVLDWRSNPRQRPEILDVTELTTLGDLEWRDWGSPQASASGVVLDFACLSGCPGDELVSYPVRVVLSGLVKRRYAAYYSHATVTAVGKPAPDWAEELTAVSLHVPKA